MKRIAVFVGLDYHQDSVQACVLDSSEMVLRNGSYENDALVIGTVGEDHGTKVHAGIESCTGAADLAGERAMRAGWTIDLAHPGFVSRMKQNPDKTDFTDARMIADLERVLLKRRLASRGPVRLRTSSSGSGASRSAGTLAFPMEQSSPFRKHPLGLSLQETLG
ncbi:MAG: transposase [Phycisphaerales bacterium]|nr:transposase [Phycisphaerales bacterium]